MLFRTVAQAPLILAVILVLTLARPISDGRPSPKGLGRWPDLVTTDSRDNDALPHSEYREERVLLIGC